MRDSGVRLRPHGLRGAWRWMESVGQGPSGWGLETGSVSGGGPGASRGDLGVIWVPFLMAFRSSLGEFRVGHSIKNRMRRGRKRDDDPAHRKSDRKVLWCAENMRSMELHLI